MAFGFNINFLEFVWIAQCHCWQFLWLCHGAFSHPGHARPGGCSVSAKSLETVFPFPLGFMWTVRWVFSSALPSLPWGLKIILWISAGVCYCWLCWFFYSFFCLFFVLFLEAGTLVSKLRVLWTPDPLASISQVLGLQGCAMCHHRWLYLMSWFSFAVSLNRLTCLFCALLDVFMWTTKAAINFFLQSEGCIIASFAPYNIPAKNWQLFYPSHTSAKPPLKMWKIKNRFY